MGIPDFESSAFDHSANFPLMMVQNYKEVLDSQRKTIENKNRGTKIAYLLEEEESAHTSSMDRHHSKERCCRRFRRFSAADLRIAKVMLQVLSKDCETIRGESSLTIRITSFIMT